MTIGSVSKSIFSDPTAHDVEHIAARLEPSVSNVCLSLDFRGDSPFIGAREGTFEIYGPDSKALREKFRRLADAINEIFGPADCPHTGLPCLTDCTGNPCLGLKIPLNKWPAP